MAKFAKHKRGDTFDLSGPVTLTYDDGVISDFTDWTPTSQIRNIEDDSVLADLTCEWLDPLTGVIRIYFPTATDTWVPGWYEIDIQLTSLTGVVVSTETSKIQIVEDITR